MRARLDQQAYRACTLCPRACAVDRHAGRTGVCGAGPRARVAHAGPHFGEEPPLTGVRGSGTVFFSGCGLGCAFCQNHQISSRGHAGREWDAAGLADLFLRVQGLGVHNLNLVTAGHYAPTVGEALEAARAQGLTLPVVWNSSGYESVATLAALEGLVDVYLPDAKYADPGLAGRASRARDYPVVARAAIAEMYRQVGHLQVDAQGLATRGLIVRHLALPGHLDDTFAVLDDLAERYGPDLHVSLMAQYRPPAAGALAPLPDDLARPLAPDEAAVLPVWMARFGFAGWVQSLEANDVGAPDFARDVPFDWSFVREGGDDTAGG